MIDRTSPAEPAGGAPLPAPLARAWGVAPPGGRRGPKARLSLEAIAQAALEVADERGRAGHSLTGVAERLGVTPNALYRYLGSRAELDVMLGEHALGPAPTIPTDLSWQQAVRRWVSAIMERHRSHPWLVDVQMYVPLMPNVLGWLDALLQALGRAGIDTGRAMWAASVIDGYVRSAAVRDRERRLPPDAAERSLWTTPDVVAQVAALARDRGLDHVATVLEGGIFTTDALEDDASFDAGLELILTGLAEGFQAPSHRSESHPSDG